MTWPLKVTYSSNPSYILIQALGMTHIQEIRQASHPKPPQGIYIPAPFGLPKAIARSLFRRGDHPSYARHLHLDRDCIYFLTSGMRK
jgi:hypothetical protein